MTAKRPLAAPTDNYDLVGSTSPPADIKTAASPYDPILSHRFESDYSPDSDEEPPRPVTNEERKEEALRLIAMGLNAREAAAGVNRNPRWIHDTYRRDPVFREKYEEAKRIRLDHLIAEAERRAMRGSDRVLMFLLANYAPEKFARANRVELTGANGQPVQVDDNTTSARVAALLAAAQLRKLVPVGPAKNLEFVDADLVGDDEDLA